MAVSYQLVIDCTSPELLAQFWAEALHYVIAPPPPDFDSWDDLTGQSAFPRRSHCTRSRRRVWTTTRLR